MNVSIFEITWLSSIFIKLHLIILQQTLSTILNVFLSSTGMNPKANCLHLNCLQKTHVKLFIKLCVCGVPWGTLNHLCSLLSFFSGYFSKGLYRLDDFQNIRGFEVWITVIATILKRTNKNNFGSQNNPRLESISSNLEVVRRCSKYQSTPSQSYWKKKFYLDWSLGGTTSTTDQQHRARSPAQEICLSTTPISHQIGIVRVGREAS